MWLCVDRIEGDTVILTDDDERVYRLSVAAYTAIVGRAPSESTMLCGEVQDGRIWTATVSDTETEARAAAARARLHRLIKRS